MRRRRSSRCTSCPYSTSGACDPPRRRSSWSARCSLAGGVLVFGEPPVGESRGARAPASRSGPELPGLPFSLSAAPVSDARIATADCLPPTRTPISASAAPRATPSTAAPTARSSPMPGRIAPRCHAHASIEAVEQHRRPVIGRPIEVEAHAIAFSHKDHFAEIADQGPAGRRRRLSALPRRRCGGGRSGRARAALERLRALPRRLARRGFRARGERCRCWPSRRSSSRRGSRACASGIRRRICRQRAPPATCRSRRRKRSEAAAARRRRSSSRRSRSRTASAAMRTTPPAGRRRCGARSRLARARRRGRPVRIVACADCHEFHGAGASGDFPQGAGDTPRPRPWDVWARVAGISISPWLLAFVGVGAVGFVAVARRVAVDQPEAQETDPDSRAAARGRGAAGCRRPASRPCRGSSSSGKWPAFH